MSYRTVVVAVTGGRASENCLRHALTLADAFDAAVIGVHASPFPLITAGWYGEAASFTAEMVELQRKANEEAASRARAMFDAACGGRSSEWRAEEGDVAASLARAAHDGDLIAVPRGPVGKPGSDGPELVEEVVLACGVPVLVVPSTAPQAPIERALVAWDGSKAASRALHGALSLLERAERVVMCAVGEDAADRLDCGASMLERHGVKVEDSAVLEPGLATGPALLAEAKRHDSTLIVMGAYGHTRLRERLLGGATRHVLRHAEVPVLFSS